MKKKVCIIAVRERCLRGENIISSRREYGISAEI